MSSIEYMLWAIMVTAAVTYMLRALPLLLLRKDIESAWLNSFLYYVPWVVLTAMVIPSVFSATTSPISAGIGLVGAIVLAIVSLSLILVSLGAASLVWAAEVCMCASNMPIP